MEKEALINWITKKFTEMGLTFQTQNGTDITILQELLDSKWGMGKKKISYEASIYAEESSRTFFMWEMTKETSSGFSFGFVSESSFQSGRTVFRKMKSIQYGLDGKAYEYDIDLGAIPRTVKETAVNSGWGFKTVLRRSQAAWPANYAVAPPLSHASGSMPAENYHLPSDEAGIFCAGCGHKMTKEALFCTRCGRRK